MPVISLPQENGLGGLSGPKRSESAIKEKDMSVKLLSTITVLALALAGCARTAKLATTWRDPGFQDASLTRLLVVAVGRTPGERRVFEDRFAAALRAHGVDARPSYALIGDGRVDSALVDAQLHRSGCDGIFISRVADRQIVRRYYGDYGAPGYFGAHGYYGPPSAYRAGWWRYYSLGYAYAAGRPYDEDQRVSVETNLYRHDKGQLVWSGISRQWLASAAGPGDETANVVRELVAELVGSGVVGSATSTSRK
jgi:hypothetical protein